MFYDFSFTIPANTPITAQVTRTCLVSPGCVDRVMVIFPTGCAALVHVRILRATHQLWPSNLDGAFASESEFLDFVENYPLDDPPFEFILSGWNEDDTYSHTIIVRFNIILVERDKKKGVADQLRSRFGLT